MSEDTEKTPLVKTYEEEDEVLTGCGATLPCNPRRPLHRYLVLIIMCFLSFGSYFCYDNPAALQDNMVRDLDISVGQFMGFYSWYSWPNVILCFFGGFLIDSVFGVRVGAIIFSLFVTVVFAMGSFLNKYWLMCVGRFIFGIGGESLAVAQNTYAVKWFQGRELNMVFGLQLSFSRVGSTVNMNVMQPIYNLVQHHFTGYKCLGIVLLVGGFMCILSLICALALGYFDKRADRILKRAKVVFFEMKFGMDPKLANSVNSLVYIISAIASPLFGFLIDKSGRNVFWVILGTFVTMACHGLLAFTFVTPFVGMAVMGLAYSVLASALWPMASMVVKQHQMQAIQNLGLATISIAAGSIVDSKGYLILEVFFLACLSIALIAAVVLYLFDAATGGVLNKSAKQRKKEREIAEEEAEREKAIN
ncbi:MFSD1-like protein [Mya arenaria]|uniref:Lysosomal dipeptide transporter MFSD1 n=1 Tax=Mya arenaria TaxID=6604 RepID=A0ABY7FZ86_MYAAR|nr:MFSD1-like protein [Mya arenaria]